MSDLWPTDLGAAAATTSPVTILKEQASLLGLKTKNIVKAYVRRFTFESAMHLRHMPAAGAKKKQPHSDSFNYGFYLQAPALDNYTYHLFTLSFGIDDYPAIFLTDDDIAKELKADSDEGIVVNDEVELVRVLSEVLASRKTRKVIHAIYSQSVDFGTDQGDVLD